mgnify:CR=1 FL=1
MAHTIDRLMETVIRGIRARRITVALVLANRVNDQFQHGIGKYGIIHERYDLYLERPGQLIKYVLAHGV